MPIPNRSANLRDYYRAPHRLSHQNQLYSGLIVSLVLWNIGTQEQQECVVLSGPRSIRERRDRRQQ